MVLWYRPRIIQLPEVQGGGRSRPDLPCSVVLAILYLTLTRQHTNPATGGLFAEAKVIIVSSEHKLQLALVSLFWSMSVWSVVV